MVCQSSPILALKQNFRKFAAGSSIFFSTISCQSDFPPVTLVEDVRILAIKAEPPEVPPGESTTISALVVDPLGGGRELEWVVALCTTDATTGQCLEYLEKLETSETEEDAESAYAECCVRGGYTNGSFPALELGGSTFASLTTATSMLEGLDEDAAREGINAQLSLLVCESGLCSSMVSEETSDSTGSISLSLPPEDSALAVKRVRVTSNDADSGNGNPIFEAIESESVRLREGGTLYLDADTDVQLVPVLDNSSFETYLETSSDGTQEIRDESPYLSWYSTDGTFDEYYSEFTNGDGSVVFSVPVAEVGTEIGIYSVVYDRRGGLDWSYFSVIVQ